VDVQGEARRSGRHLRVRRWSRRNHAGPWVRESHGGISDRHFAGAFCFRMVTAVKSRFGYDDFLDAFGVHGPRARIGALLTGLFASSAINPIFKDASGNVVASGVLEGIVHRMLNQSIVGTLIILKIVDVAIGLRVDEQQGLDLSQHAEEGDYRETSA
jgi:Amt family ammonium transporter